MSKNGYVSIASLALFRFDLQDATEPPSIRTGHVFPCDVNLKLKPMKPMAGVYALRRDHGIPVLICSGWPLVKTSNIQVA